MDVFRSMKYEHATMYMYVSNITVSPPIPSVLIKLNCITLVKLLHMFLWHTKGKPYLNIQVFWPYFDMYYKIVCHVPQ